MISLILLYCIIRLLLVRIHSKYNCCTTQSEILRSQLGIFLIQQSDNFIFLFIQNLSKQHNMIFSAFSGDKILLYTGISSINFFPSSKFLQLIPWLHSRTFIKCALQSDVTSSLDVYPIFPNYLTLLEKCPHYVQMDLLPSVLPRIPYLLM